MKNSLAVRDRIVEENFWVAEAVLKSLGIFPANNDYADFHSDACLGLLQAASRYDASHPSKASFWTFSYNRIRGKVFNGMEERNPLNPRDRDLIDKINERVMWGLLPGEIMDALGISLMRYNGALADYRFLYPVSIDSTEGDGKTTLIESIGASAVSPMEHIYAAETYGNLVELVKLLSPTDQAIFNHRLVEGRAQQEVCGMLHLSRDSVMHRTNTMKNMLLFFRDHEGEIGIETLSDMAGNNHVFTIPNVRRIANAWGYCMEPIYMYKRRTNVGEAALKGMIQTGDVQVMNIGKWMYVVTPAEHHYKGNGH